MKKKQILLPSKKFFKSEEEDLTIPLNLNETQKLLREGDRDIVLDISDLFDEERNKSKNYKIYGKIKMIFKNMYYGTTTYNPLLKFLYPKGEDVNLGYLPYNEYSLLRNDILRESYDFNSNPKVVLKGTEYTGHTITTNFDAPHKNWNFYLSYVYSGDTQYPMTITTSNGVGHTFSSGDGIPFVVEDDGLTYILTSPVEHGMTVGENVVISGQINPIIEVGNETYNSEKYVLKIYKTSTNTLYDNTIVFGKRCIDITKSGTTISTYYVHKHKTLTTYDECVIDNAGFEKSIWKEEKKLVFENALDEEDVLVERNRMETLLYDFNNPIVLDNMLNNLGYTPTEVYVTVIFRNGNGYFLYPPKVGFDFNFHDTWIDKHFNGSIPTQRPHETGMGLGTTFTKQGITFTSGNTLNENTILVGAFVEFNNSEMKERIISESFHKMIINKNVFNHQQSSNVDGFSGATINNQFGLFFQPHYRIKLRQLSPYVESSETNNVYNLPENLKYFPDEGLWKWRDLYDHGYIDPDGFGTNYPFTNNTHYVKNDINFYLRNERNSINKTEGITNFNDRKFNC